MPVGFLTVLAVCYFGDVRGWIFSERDLLPFFIPLRQFWVEEVKNLVFPLWNPYYFNGHPLFATLQAGVLYPSSILFLFLPFDWAFNLNIEIHFILSGWFTYLLLRGMKASQYASLIAGAGFMLSGYLISVHHLLSTLLSVTWVPLFFLCYFSAIKNNEPGHAILSGVVGVVMFLGGGVEVCYLTFGVTFYLTLFPELVLGTGDCIKLARRLLIYVSFCLIFIGLSAVQLIPFLELSQLSNRSSGLSYSLTGTWSLHPYDLVEFFLPDQYGLATNMKKYWAYQNWLRTIYMGGIPFILALIFFKKWDRRAQGFLLLFCIALGLAMGNNTLFHHYLYDYLPLFNKLRYPVKFIFLAVLILCIAAGLGFDYFKKGLSANDPESHKWARNILYLGFVGMILFGILNLFNEPLVAYFKALGWDYPKYNVTESNLFNIKRVLAFSSLFCLGLFLYSQPRFKKPFVLASLFALFILDLFFAHHMFYEKIKYQDLMKPGENMDFIQSDPDQFRVFVPVDTRNARVLNKEVWKRYDIRKEKLLLGLLGNHRHFDIDGIGVMLLDRWKKIMDMIKSASVLENTNLLNLMNVKYVLSIPPITSSDYKLVNSVYPRKKYPDISKELLRSLGIKIYENKKMLPRAFLVSSCRVMRSEEEYKETLQGENFNPQKVLLLDKEPGDLPCRETSSMKKQQTVNIESYRSNALEILVKTEEKQFLFLSESYYPGWKAYLNGKEVEILRANYLFRAIIVGPGTHHIRFEYDPLSFKLGLAITSATILFCGFYFYLQSRNRKFLIANSI